MLLLVGISLPTTEKSRSVSDDLTERLARGGWGIIRTSSKSTRLGRLLDMVASAWFRRHDYAVAHVDVFSGPAFFWAEAVCAVLARAHKPFVLTLHGGNLPVFARRWPGRVRRLLGAAALVTAPSPYLLAEMRSFRDDLRLLPNPLDVAAYRFRPRTQPAPDLVWLRAFHAIYNPCLAPRVLASLGRSWPASRLVMVGPDKGDGSFQATQRTALALDVASRVSMPGGVPKADVPIWLDRGDIFLNTTSVDNTPVSVLEAMACGLCVVSTNVGGIPYLLSHEQDALLVPPDDVERMAQAADRLLKDRQLAAHLSLQGRKKAEQFDWSCILPQWEQLFLATAEAQTA